MGWYKDATVYRGREMYQGRQFNIQTLPENAYLIGEKERTFTVPRARSAGYGFGQSNIWYANDEKNLWHNGYCRFMPFTCFYG